MKQVCPDPKVTLERSDNFRKSQMPPSSALCLTAPKVLFLGTDKKVDTSVTKYVRSKEVVKSWVPPLISLKEVQKVDHRLQSSLWNPPVPN